jgi:nucleosome binding factor SPN SPT16 subunit
VFTAVIKQSMEISIDAGRFHERLLRLRDHWQQHLDEKWDHCGAVCIPMGAAAETDVYSKSSALHLFLMGYEFPDSVMVITKSAFYFMSAPKKIKHLQELTTAGGAGDMKVHLLPKTKDQVQNSEQFQNIVQAIKGKKLGNLTKANFHGEFIPSWMSFLDSCHIESVDIAPALGLFLSVKEDSELELCKRASVLSNKVLKNVFIAEMEDVIDKDVKITHSAFSTKVESVLYDPSSIGIKLAVDVVESCYQPIIQSGGKYNIKPSAQSNDDTMKFDVIICTLGARYKSYCANVSRTFMVDPVFKISNAYAVLSDLYDRCLEQMLAGNDIRSVLETGKSFMAKRDPSLAPFLSKTLGFATGLEFRDSSMLLNQGNSSKFSPGMVFVLSVGFQDIPLSDADKADASDNIKGMSSFSLLISDTLCIQDDGSVPDVLTKASRSFEDVSYNMEKPNEDGDEKKPENEEEFEAQVETRRSMRTGEDRKLAEESLMKRMLRQQELMERKISEARRRIESSSGGADQVDPATLASELKTYRDTASYPHDLVQNRLKVDMNTEAILVPIDGQPVPFHISTVKNISMPEAEKATYLRINFYTPGATVSKDTPKNMQHLIAKHGHQSSFIKELTFRSLDPRNLTLVYRMILELRKRVRQREQKEDEERDLVTQAKLIRIKDQRVPRLQDLTMRPQISGRKCVGTLEAHQNGLRFTSTKGEVVDIMYSNIKHAIYQPCEKSVMVLIHFHLKDFVMVGKKKQKDVQFFTEVIDSSLNLEGTRRSAYDPDEIDDEQREREMKKRLNTAFKEFCRKVERVAKHYEFDIEFDIPYIELSFYGNPNKEMVMIQPSVKCLVNLTESPFFVIDLSEVEHVHFERVNMGTKNCDMTIIFKNFEQIPKSISAIDIQYFDMIQDWLNDVEITFTSGIQSINWKVVMEAVKDDVRFFFDTDEEGESKPAGWNFLRADASDDEEDEEEDGDSSFAEASSESSEEESSSDEDDSDFDEDDSGSDGEEEEDEEEEAGQVL